MRGLRTFVQEPTTNPGRANVFTLEERIVVVDYAHNEAGMTGLTEVLAGLRPRDARDLARASAARATGRTRCCTRSATGRREEPTM